MRPRLRLRPAVVGTTLLVAIIFSGLAILAVRAVGSGAHAAAERDLLARLAQADAALVGTDSPDQEGVDDTWLVDFDRSGTPTTTALGATTLEPPIATVATSADASGQLAEIEVHQGRHLLVGSLPVPSRTPQHTAATVAAVDLAGTDADDDAARRNAVIGGVAMVAITALVTYAVDTRTGRRRARDQESQRSFLDDAAHEMRTPLAVIQASAGQALARPRSTEEYVRSLSEVRAAAERAAHGVGELLDLARLESGQAVPRRAPLRLDLLAEEVAAAVRVDGCAIEAVSSGAVVVDADLALIRHAVVNIVTNAAARSVHVTLLCRTDGGDAVLETLDDGPGFAPEVLPHVFDRFRRGDRAGSSGLGLAIVRRVADVHGGRVEAANRVGGGGVVRLLLPARRA